MKKCPFCSEEIQNDAIKCRYCGEFIVDKESENIDQSVPEKKRKKSGEPLWLVVLVGIIFFLAFKAFDHYKDKKKVRQNLSTDSIKAFEDFTKSYCIKSDGYQYVSMVGCSEDKKISKEAYDAKNKKKKETKLSGSQNNHDSNKDFLKPKMTHCIYANGEIYYANKYCKHINNETIVGITKEDFYDIKKYGVNWVTIFIKRGGDPSQIVKNNIDNEKVIAELQEKIVELLENSKATNAETNDLVKKIQRTKDLKILGCMISGNINILNLAEFMEDCL